MPVLKIKKNGSWVEVWGAISGGTTGGTLPKLTTISIPVSGWVGSEATYSQVVAVNGVNVNSKLDLQPSAAQIAELQDAEVSLMAVNNNGTVTIFAFNGKPTADMEMQMLITDVEVIA